MQVVNVLPFVLIGIGVDDMFVLISSLENIPEGLPVEEVGPPAHCLNTPGALPAHALRQLPSSNLDTVHTQRVAQGIASAGVSITITSLTDFLVNNPAHTQALINLRSYSRLQYSWLPASSTSYFFICSTLGCASYS